VRGAGANNHRWNGYVILSDECLNAELPTIDNGAFVACTPDEGETCTATCTYGCVVEGACVHAV
jgi:hypothetical protein